MRHPRESDLVSTFEWWTIVLAALAVAVSIGTAVSVARGARRAAKRAAVTVYLHRLSDIAQVLLPNGGAAQTGYHLVLRNRGPADATQVRVTVVGPDGEELRLEALDAGELPLASLDAGSRYPIPFVLPGDVHEGRRGYRRFTVLLEWRDGRSRENRKAIPVRRGETGGAGD